MDNNDERTTSWDMSPYQQRCAAAAAIVGMHAVVLWQLVQMRTLLHTAERTPDQSLVYIGGFELPASPSGSARQGGRAHAARAASRDPVSSSGSPITSSVSPSTESHSDWSLAAQEAAGDIVSELAQREKRNCDDSQQPGSSRLKCRKHPGRFGWSKQPQRAGFDNSLPYLRLGRCVLVLGIVGCPVGAAPEANGQLFADLKDADRDRSSVPDNNEINEPADAAARRLSVLVDPAARRQADSR